jgi:hypothetical protein
MCDMSTNKPSTIAKGLFTFLAIFFFAMLLILSLVNGAGSVVDLPSTVEKLVRSLIELSNAWHWSLWLILTVFFLGIFGYQNWKVFGALDGLNAMQKEIADASEQRQRLDESFGKLRTDASEQRKRLDESFERLRTEFTNLHQVTRRDDMKVRQIFYLTAIIKPLIEQRLQEDRGKLVALSAGDTQLRYQAYRDADQAPTYLDSAIGEMLPGYTADLNPEAALDENMIPNQAWAELYYRNQVGRWLHALSAIEDKRSSQTLDHKFWMYKE